MLKTGIKGTRKIFVTEDNTAKRFKSGELDVFATPAMVTLIEETAWRSIAEELSSEETTVGIKIDVRHISATPIGLKVRCETELVEIDRKRLVFYVEVFDEYDKICDGTHERFIVNRENFLNKVTMKR
ncbi:MAG: thioesterase family protein [Clostridia bacterium]|nr:thioesterase family protein [Clostridia bacterium]